MTTPPAKAGDFTRKLLALTAASQSRLGSLPKALPTLATEGPVRAPGHTLSLIGGTAAHPQLLACLFYPAVLFPLERADTQF